MEPKQFHRSDETLIKGIEQDVLNTNKTRNSVGKSGRTAIKSILEWRRASRSDDGSDIGYDS